MNATIQLFMDDAETPPYYWVEVMSAYDSDEGNFRHAGHVTFVASLNGEGHYDLDLLVQSCDSEQKQNPIPHAVELGNLASSGNACGVVIDVVLSGVRVGGGHPKLNSATQVSRPIPRFS